jgi:hypothetical protein
VSDGQGGVRLPLDVDRQAWARDVAAATVALSNAVLGFGEAIAGTKALTEALDAEVDRHSVGDMLRDVAAVADGEDPAGYGVNEDDRRPPEDGEAWVCPRGLPDIACAALHDHYPSPRRRRRGEG